MTAVTLQLEDTLAKRLLSKSRGMSLQSYILQLLQIHSSDSVQENVASQSITISPFIKSLQLKGGEKVPSDINPMDAIIGEKYL